MKSTIEQRPISAEITRRVSPYVATSVAPALLVRSKTPHRLLPSPTWVLESSGSALPAEEIDGRLQDYSHIPSLMLISPEEVDAAFEAQPNRARRHRAKVRRVKGLRELVESEADFSHLV